MNMTCKVAMDLAELYKAGLVSEESAAEIRTHLKECAACRKYYKAYSTDDWRRPAVPEENAGLEEMEERLYADLARKMNRRRIVQIIGTGAAVGAGSIMLAVGLIMMSKYGTLHPEQLGKQG